MIAVDTNVLLRCITLDDAGQLPAARLLLAHPEGVFISKSVLLEVEWALRDVFNLPITEVRKSLSILCGMAHVCLENEDQVAQALEDHAQGMDFADAMHAASSQADEGLYTFDRKFVKKAMALGRDVHLARSGLAGRSH